MWSNGKRDARRRKRLARQPRENDRVLATGEQQGRPLELSGYFAKHMDAFAFELWQMAAGRQLQWFIPDEELAPCLLRPIIAAAILIAGGLDSEEALDV
jgi:hypothetical protein